MLGLLIAGIDEVCHPYGCMWNDIHSNFNEDWYRLSSNIKVLPHKFEGL
jgi:hypothetical protein